MEITCPNCKIKRSIDASRLPKNKTKVTTLCKSCGHKFTLFLDTLEVKSAEESNSATGNTQGPKTNPGSTTRPPAQVPTSGKSRGGPSASMTRGGPKTQGGPKTRGGPNTQSGLSRPPRLKTRSIGVILSKGGVGKTTTAVNMAAGLALSGYKVLLVDTDTQGQSSYMLGCKPEYGLAELVAKEVEPQKAIFKARENLWILSGGRALAGVKRLIDRKDFGGELTLSETLTPFEHLFDFVIVDSSPGWDPITVNVLFYVKELLIPVSLEVMSLQGLSEFSKSLATIQKYRSQLGITYILPTFSDDKIESRLEILTRLKELYSDYLCTPIRYCPDLAEAPAYGRTIYEYANESTGSLDYKTLVRTVTDGDALF